MRVLLLAVPIIGAGVLVAASAQAADMVPSQPLPAYGPPPIAEAPPPVVVEPPPVVAEPVAPVGPPACWRYGAVGWGWYPCVAGPPPYWRGYAYGYRGRPYWPHGRRWHESRW